MTVLSDCGCCSGITVETPVAVKNRPGLSAIAYRVGTHPRFKASMLARLSENGVPELAALRDLKTRDDDDFTIALLDAWAVVGDILTFYQERIANESYLRTATERQSVIELARLIGYELRPGVAASTYLAFTLESGAGAPAEVPLDKGLRVQSVPGPGEKPQTFETVEAIVARPQWNVLRPLQKGVQPPRTGDTHAVLAGVTTNLRVGDLLLFAAEPKAKPDKDEWSMRRIAVVDPDNDRGTTTVRWTKPLDNLPAAPRVFVLRLRASIFGYNAMPWAALPVALRVGDVNPDPAADAQHKFIKGAFADDKDHWAEAALADGDPVHLDAVYKEVVPDSWLVLSSDTAKTLYHVKSVTEQPVAKFNISGKSTTVVLEGETLTSFSPRSTAVFAASEELPLAETPLATPLDTRDIELDGVVDGLTKGRTLLIVDATSGEPVVLEEVLSPSATTAAPAPAPLPSEAQQRRTALTESVTVTTTAAIAHTVLKLARPGLSRAYDRATTSIYANVALSTHGETVKDEVLGSGDAGKPYQHFTLRQAPLTYTPSDVASGGASTLEVRVNDLLWKEVATLYGHGPRERIYVTETDDGGVATVQFGDGHTGARLPMGRENVKATYRKGIGVAGLVKAQQLSLLLTRPLGLKSAVNPLAPTGAQDPQSLADARTNAPVTVLTLERIVSLQDYEDYARAFSGIAKALATWTWSGHTRQVFVTVAGINGADVVDRSTLQTSLLSSMQKAGDNFVPVRIASYRKPKFKVAALVKIDPLYLPDKVLGAVESALRASFSFDARAFGQPVTLSEVITVMQDVPGVVAVDVTKLHLTTRPETRETFLPSEAPQAGAGPNVLPAQLLTLDAGPIELAVMS
jgi:hypothetical protein